MIIIFLPGYFGIIFAILGFIAAFSARKQNWFNKVFKNRTLTVLTLPYAISCIVIGAVSFLNIPFNASISIIIAMYIIQYISRGPFYTLIRRYLSNFSTTKARNRIYSFATFFESLSSVVYTLTAAFIVERQSSSFAFLIIGLISFVALVLILDYMRTRVGLKPEEYDKSEIEMLNLK